MFTSRLNSTTHTFSQTCAHTIVSSSRLVPFCELLSNLLPLSMSFLRFNNGDSYGSSYLTTEAEKIRLSSLVRLRRLTDFFNLTNLFSSRRCLSLNLFNFAFNSSIVACISHFKDRIAKRLAFLVDDISKKKCKLVAKCLHIEASQREYLPVLNFVRQKVRCNGFLKNSYKTPNRKATHKRTAEMKRQYR